MHYSVIIVGAGPAGAVLAYLLAKSGISVLLLERHSDFHRQFRGEILMPGGLEPLAQIGLWKQFNDVPQVRLNGVNLFIKGKRASTVDFEKQLFGEYGPRWVSQPHLLEMIVAECSQYKNFELLRGTRVRDVVKNSHRVIGVSAETNGTRREIRADLVIGADGRTSSVRRALKLPVRSDVIPMDIIWLKVPGPGSAEPRIHAYTGHGRLLIAAPTYDHQLQIGLIIKKGSFKALREQGQAGLLDELVKYVDPELKDHLTHHYDNVSNPFLLSTVSDCLIDWSYPGSFLIGDAAHTMSPVGGQGLNIAIRDAIVTANHLVPELTSGNPLTDLTQTTHRIQAERTKEVGSIQKLQALPPKILLTDTWWTRLLFLLLLWVSRGRRKLIKTISRKSFFGKFTMGVTEVRWQAPDRHQN